MEKLFIVSKGFPTDKNYCKKNGKPQIRRKTVVRVQVPLQFISRYSVLENLKTYSANPN
jgi:hypothetical protein